MYLSNSSFAKEEGVHHKMYKTKLVHCCDVVPNLVVEIEIFNFGLFVCLYLTFCQFCKTKMVQSWFRKLSWNQDCDVVSNMVVEIAIYNFDIFHTALGATSSYDHIFFHFCARLHIKACVHMPLTGRELHFQSYFLINSNCSHSGHTSQKSWICKSLNPK